MYCLKSYREKEDIKITIFYQICPLFLFFDELRFFVSSVTKIKTLIKSGCNYYYYSERSFAMVPQYFKEKNKWYSGKNSGTKLKIIIIAFIVF